MKIGILSDSHCQSDRVRAALSLFARQGVTAVVHCGDIGGTRCLEALTEGPAATYAVLGNMDDTGAALAEEARMSGIHLGSRYLEVPLEDGAALAVTHGHDASLLNQLIQDGKHRYVCHGHTHRVCDERCGGVRIINPGSLVRSRDPGHPTVAILDTATDGLEFMRIE